MAMSFLVVIPFLCCVAYWIYYLKRHLYLFSTTGQKIGYGLFTCVMLAILGPSIFPLLIALVLLSIAISIALFLLSVVMTIIALFDGGGSKKRRFSLDNGDEVTEKSGLFGEKYYEGRSGNPMKPTITAGRSPKSSIPHRVSHDCKKALVSESLFAMKSCKM